MEWKEFTGEERNLDKLIAEGVIVPTSVVDAEVIAQEKCLNIHINSLETITDKVEQAVFFYWSYEDKNPIFIRKTEISEDKSICVEIEQTFLFQMKLYKYSSVRMAMAITVNGKYACCFFRNKNIKNTELSDEERIIGKLTIFEAKAYYAYWTAGGILCLSYRDNSKFDAGFFKPVIDYIHCEDKALILSFDLPINSDEVSIVPHSMSDNSVANDISCNIISDISNGRKRRIDAKVSLNGKSEKTFDAFYFQCTMGKLSEKIKIDKECMKKREIVNMVSQNGDSCEAVAAMESDDLFTLQVAEKIYPAMLSIVTAVYNTKPFLAEMINSVLEQQLGGLQEYIIGNKCKNYQKRNYLSEYEFILVDDGSTDGSAEILDDYARISERIKVIHKENGGVSSARNAGIEVARGKYINFADSDDKLSDKFIQECVLFFEEHETDVDIITTPIKFFDALNEEHWCNKKFDFGSRILYLEKEYKNVLMYVNASLFKSSLIINQRKFNEKLKTAEDINFIYSFFLEERASLGLVTTCNYFYRRRSTGEESLIQASKKDKNRYLEYFSVGMNYLTTKSYEKYNQIPRYIQFLIACDLQWRFLEDPKAEIAKSILSETEFQQYKNYLKELLEIIDLEIIWSQDKIWREQKFFMSKLKYNKEPERIIEKDSENIQYRYSGNIFVDASSNYLQIDRVEIFEDRIEIEGTNFSFENNSELYIDINGEKQNLIKYLDYDYNKYSIGEVIFWGHHFLLSKKFATDILEYELKFYEKIGDNFVIKNDLRFGNRANISKHFSDSYYEKYGWCIRREGTIRIRPITYNVKTLINRYSLNMINRYESDFRNQLRKSNVDEDLIRFRDELLTIKRDYAINNSTRIWLISDRVNMAGDNGEVFFEFLCNKKLNDIVPYFVINKDSRDYERLQKIGNVVEQGSLQHKILHVLAEYTISSQFDEYVQNPFYGENVEGVFTDLIYQPKFIFLQHGVTKDDLSNHLNKADKNIYGFITSSKAEKQSILNGDYMYEESKVWLLGMPRYDRLHHDEKKLITVMPTWRLNLCKKHPTDKKRLTPKEGFENTEYCKFYSNLLNNHDLLEFAETKGYQICFRPHPVIMDNIKDFHLDKRVKVLNHDVTYNEVFAISNLCVTDYSSVAMDFAYLHKPIIYTQFDKEKFFSGEHVYKKGYFDYEKDGFGEVTYDMNSLIKLIKEYIENDCQIKSKYEKRINSFFAYNDTNNCERLFNKLY